MPRIKSDGRHRPEPSWANLLGGVQQPKALLVVDTAQKEQCALEVSSAGFESELRDLLSVINYSSLPSDVQLSTDSMDYVK